MKSLIHLLAILVLISCLANAQTTDKNTNKSPSGVEMPKNLKPFDKSMLKAMIQHPLNKKIVANGSVSGNGPFQNTTSKDDNIQTSGYIYNVNPIRVCRHNRRNFKLLEKVMFGIPIRFRLMRLNKDR